MAERKLGVMVPAFNEEANIGDTLDALYNQKERTAHHLVVDNGSTDRTVERVEAYKHEHPEFPLDIIVEEEKGTGSATDAGGRYLAEKGFPILARTDSDSQPNIHWTSVITDRFERDPNLQLLGGISDALHDQYYRFGDNIIAPVGSQMTRAAIALVRRDPTYLKIAAGHNLATRADAFQAVDGFPHTSIATTDEDVVYTKRIADKYGRRAIRIDKDLRVSTSMRRAREYGLVGLELYYLFPGIRSHLKDSIDIR